MGRTALPLPAVLLLFAASHAHADTGYRCVDAAGRIAFQDRPCPKGSEASAFHYDKPPPGAAPPPVAAATATPALPAPGAPPPAPIPVAPLYACTRADNGERYYSDTGVTQPYYVPAGALGVPPRGFGDAMRAARPSAPELSRPQRVAPNGANALAGAYVQVQDRCARLSDYDACAARRKELGDNRSRQRNAFKAERSTLEARAAAVQSQMSGCP